MPHDRHFTAVSPNGIASATVDGRAEVVTIAIQDRALRGPGRRLIGQAIVEAVSAARADALGRVPEEMDDEPEAEFSVFEPRPSRKMGRW